MARSFSVLLSILILGTGLSSSQPTINGPSVCVTELGCMKGIFMPGVRSANFEAFLGIPYAVPPIGTLRFSNPVPYPQFAVTLNATAPKADCIQKNYLLKDPVISGNEDCLYLNIYRPMGVRKDSNLIVMVYIFGGGFFTGTGNPYIHGPEYFMDTAEVILVTFGYRLGPFGFLSTNDSNMSGNWGLKDQRLVLRWVKQHIRDFGGNPKLVTVFGQSAGAVSAHMHMLSKSSEGLFRNVIALSGVANAPFAFNENPLEQTREMAKLCGISGANNMSTAELTQALRRIDPVTLLKAGDGLKYWHVAPLTNFRPVAESSSEPDAFLTENPIKIIESGNFTAVPWMASIVPQEGAVAALSILENATLVSDFNNHFDLLLQKFIEWPQSRFTKEQLRAKTELVAKEYFGNQRSLDQGSDQSFLDFLTDRYFYHPLYTTFRHYVAHYDVDANPFFLFKFNYQGQSSFAPLFIGGLGKRNYGVVHCDDLIYLYRSLLFPNFATNSPDAQVVEATVAHMVYFAKYSNIQNSHLLRPCNRQNFLVGGERMCDYRELVNVQNGSTPFEVRTNNAFNVRRMQFWDELLAN